MKKSFFNRPALIRVLLAVLLVAAAAATVITSSFARYRTTVRSAGQVDMDFAFAPDSVWLLANARDEEGLFTNTPIADSEGICYRAPNNWTLISEDKSVYQLTFLVSNEHEIGHPAAFDQDFFIEVFVSEGISQPSDLIIQAETETGTYLAKGSAVEEDSALYMSYGPGWIYRFTNTSGEAVTWRLPGMESTFIPMKVTVWGAFAYPGAVTVIATGIPT